LRRTLSSLKVLLVMLLVTKSISSLKVAISAENKSPLKRKTRRLCGVSATNLVSSLKASNSDDLHFSTKDAIYITLTHFFPHTFSLTLAPFFPHTFSLTPIVPYPRPATPTPPASDDPPPAGDTDPPPSCCRPARRW